MSPHRVGWLLACAGAACSAVDPADPLVYEARPAVEALAQMSEQYELLGVDESAAGRCRAELKDALGALDRSDAVAARESLGRGLACTLEIGRSVTSEIEELRARPGPDPVGLLGRELDLGDGFYTLVGVRVRERDGVTIYELSLRSESGLHETRTVRMR